MAEIPVNTVFYIIKRVNQRWARDPIKNQHLVSDHKKYVTLKSSKLEPAVWSRDTGHVILELRYHKNNNNKYQPGSMNISEKPTTNKTIKYNIFF